MKDRSNIMTDLEKVAIDKNYKVKSNVSKTAIKAELEEKNADISKIAHIVENQSITIK